MFLYYSRSLLSFIILLPIYKGLVDIIKDGNFIREMGKG